MQNLGEAIISTVLLVILTGSTCAKQHEKAKPAPSVTVPQREAPGMGVLVRDLPDGAQEIVPIRCEEDMPCWDCRTMGNKICGPNDPGPADLHLHGSGTGKAM